MPEITEQLIQLGPTAVVAIVAFWAIVEVLKLKRNNNKNGNGIILKMLQKLENNHLGTINTKLDNLKENQKDMADKLDEIVKLLIQIKTKLK